MSPQSGLLLGWWLSWWECMVEEKRSGSKHPLGDLCPLLRPRFPLPTGPPGTKLFKRWSGKDTYPSTVLAKTMGRVVPPYYLHLSLNFCKGDVYYVYCPCKPNRKSTDTQLSSVYRFEQHFGNSLASTTISHCCFYWHKC